MPPAILERQVGEVPGDDVGGRGLFAGRKGHGSRERGHRRVRVRAQRLTGLDRLVTRSERPADAGHDESVAVGLIVRPGLKQGEGHRTEVGLLVQLAGRLVGHDDPAHADIAPGAGLAIDDLQLGRLALPFVNAKGSRPHAVVVVTGGRANGLAVDQQIDARLAWVIASADPEAEKLALDGERPAGELAGLVVFLADVAAGGRGVGVDHAEARSAHVALVLRHLRFEHRPRAEGRSFDLPPLVGFLLEIFQHDLGARGRRAGRGTALHHGELRTANRAIFLGRHRRRAVRHRRPARMAADGIAQVTVETRLDDFLPHVLDLDLNDRGRQARIIDVQGDEGREDLQRDDEGLGRIAVLDVADRIFAAEGDFGKEAPWKLQAATTDPASVATTTKVNGKSLQHGALGHERMGVVGVARADLLVEDIPMPEIAVAAKVELARAEPADRHADLLQLVPAVDRAAAPGRQRLDPRGAQLFVGRDQPGEVGRLERPGHRRRG